MRVVSREGRRFLGKGGLGRVHMTGRVRFTHSSPTGRSLRVLPLEVLN